MRMLYMRYNLAPIFYHNLIINKNFNRPNFHLLGKMRAEKISEKWQAANDYY